MLVRAPTRIYRNWVADSQRWNAWKPRTGDVVIATYPKSGTTWMQQIVSLLVFQSPEPRPIADIAPWLDQRSMEPLETLIERLERQEHRRFLKSHVPADGMPIHDGVRYIHVARDGRDACLSYHNHCRSFSEARLAQFDVYGCADEMLQRPYPRAPEAPRDFYRRWIAEGIGDESDGMPFGSWFNCERTWWAERGRPNLLFVHYRDLKADLDGEMRRVAAFLDIEVPETLWSKLVAAAGFEAMKRVGDTLHPFISRNWIGGTTRFFDKGDNDRWKGVLSISDIEEFETKMRDSLPAACARWLQLGRLEAGDPAPT